RQPHRIACRRQLRDPWRLPGHLGKPHRGSETLRDHELARHWPEGGFAMTQTTTPIDWRERAAAARFDGRALIGGQRVAAQDGQTFERISPIDGRAFAQAARGRAPDIDAAVASARAAFADGRWARKAPAARKRILMKFSELIMKHKD